MQLQRIKRKKPPDILGSSIEYVGGAQVCVEYRSKIVASKPHLMGMLPYVLKSKIAVNLPFLIPSARRQHIDTVNRTSGFIRIEI